MKSSRKDYTLSDTTQLMFPSSGGLEGRSKKFRPEAFARILAAILKIYLRHSDARFEGWFGPGVNSSTASFTKFLSNINTLLFQPFIGEAVENKRGSSL